MTQIPNILTLSRVAAIPLLVAAFYLEPPIGSHVAFVVFTLAGVTDYFDGMLARRMGVVSKFGRFLDPVADKLMVGTALLMLVATDIVVGIHVVAAAVILLREILVSGLREHLAELAVTVPVSRLAKWKTAVQMVALGALIWTEGGRQLGLPAFEVGLWGLWLAAALTLVTGYDYLRAGLRHLRMEGGA